MKNKGLLQTWGSCLLARGGTHLVTADVEPPGARVQLHYLVDHGSDQCQGLLCVGVQGIGETCHFPEVSKSLMLQHKLWGDNRKAGNPGEKLAPELPAVGLLPLHPTSLVSIRVPRGASGAALGTRARALSNLAAWSTALLLSTSNWAE